MKSSQKNKAVIITGANSGIGAATALEFAQNGFTVIALGRDEKKLKDITHQCNKLTKNPKTIAITVDLKSSKSIQKATGTILKLPNIQVECLVNNAGIFSMNSFSESKPVDWQEQFQVNFFGHLDFTQPIFKYFIKNHLGSIINVSSTLGLKPVANTFAYSAAKAAMNSWTQTLALEGAPYNVRVNAICPGIVDTPIHKFHNLKGKEKALALKKMGPQQPLGRVGTATEIAKSIYFLSSNNSSWTTGLTMAIDGGIMLA